MREKLKTAVYARLFFFCVLAFCAGVAAGFLTRIPLYAAVALAAAAFLFCLPALRRRWYAALFLLALAAGMLLAAADEAAVRPFPAESGESVSVYGKVCERTLPGAEDENAVFCIRPRDIDGLAYTYGRVRVICAIEEQPALGDEVLVSGTVLRSDSRQNAGSFDYRAYMRQQDISGTVSALYGGRVTLLRENRNPLSALTDRLRMLFNEQIQRLDAAAAAAVKGIFLGDRSDMSYAQKEDLVQSGILHAFAISGLHIGYVLLFSTFAFSFLRRRRAAYLLANTAVLFFYACFMGLTPSVCRAFIMAEAGLLALTLGERRDTYTALAAAALLCLLYRPAWIFAAGFQLSFITVFFIVYLSEPMRELFAFAGRLGPVLAASCSAGLAAMPLVAYYYNTVSPLSFLLSPVAVLIVGACVVCGLFAMLTVPFLPSLAFVLVYAAGTALRLLGAAAHWLTSFGGSFFVVAAPALAVVFAFYLLLLLTPLLRKYAGRLGVLVFCLVLAVGFSVSGMHWRGLPVLRGEVMEICFLDVGQGDCAFIMAPDGKTVLIDGGGSGRRGNIGEYVLLPYLKSRGVGKIDLLINTHPDYDHTDGLISVLENMPVEYAMVSGAPGLDNGETERAAAEGGAVLLRAVSGQNVSLGKYISLDILFPPEDLESSDDNEASVICLLSYGEHSFLFTGDTVGEGLDFIIDSGLRADVLKVPHHGSYYNFDPLMYETVQPRYAVISCGRDNAYGHPHQEVISYLQQQGIEILRTDRQGEIRFYTNGSELAVRTYR